MTEENIKIDITESVHLGRSQKFFSLKLTNSHHFALIWEIFFNDWNILEIIIP
ncbi:hypothetical protein Fmac_024078 [Flemingia macrophylla]|uniref:Uncharacterized protein n=1 Tax=Flemingia macrophylla TaxID=520843 RepID=A0ABD1LNC9_9FABA